MLKPQLWLLVASLITSTSLNASIEDYYPYKVMPSSSNYGTTGIMEVPNARLMQEASLRLNFSSSWPNEFTTLTASPFDWLEASYRYVEIKNQLYGPAAYSGNQTFKDKGFDIKTLIREESFLLPAVAVGFRDVAGTGLFSSEYIVSTKRIRNSLDLTLGLGWGDLGRDDNISNPFSSIDEAFNIRSDQLTAGGGSFRPKNWFSGNTAIFGGLELDLPKRGLRLKLEYDPTRPDKQRFVDSGDGTRRILELKSRFNIGVSYFWSENLTFSSSFERGTQFRVSFNLRGNFLNDSIPKPQPKAVQKLNKEQRKNIEKNNDLFYRSLNLSLRDETIYIQGANLKKNEIDVAVASSRFYTLTRPIGRTARIVAALAPDGVDKINIHAMNGDFEVAKVSFGKDYFEESDKGNMSPIELLKLSKIDSNNSKPLYKEASFMPTVNFPEYSWSMSPAIKHQIGGPEGFYLGQLFWLTNTRIKFRRNLALYTSFGINIYDTFKGLNNPSQSTIPRVRSDIQDYLSQGKNNLQRMQLEYFGAPYKDIFTKVDIGYLEEMFGGVGGEILYRPFDKKYSIGMSVHKVKQRAYDQRFSFKEYSTTTGHIGVYYDLPYQLRSQLHIGKYLAGDKGVTLDLSRRSKSGFTLGVFATKTNLSAEEFGEGSFDKGFYISVPTQLFYSDFRSGNISFGLHPLTKDGGAMLNQHNPLISILGDSNYNSIIRDWNNILN